MATPNPVAPQVISVADLITDYHQACEAITAWEERREHIAADIMERLPVGAQMDGIQVMPPRRALSAERAIAVLSPEKYMSICDLKPVAAKARAVLTDDELAQIYSTGTGKAFVRRSS